MTWLEKGRSLEQLQLAETSRGSRGRDRYASRKVFLVGWSMHLSARVRRLVPLAVVAVAGSTFTVARWATRTGIARARAITVTTAVVATATTALLTGAAITITVITRAAVAVAAAATIATPVRLVTVATLVAATVITEATIATVVTVATTLVATTVIAAVVTVATVVATTPVVVTAFITPVPVRIIAATTVAAATVATTTATTVISTVVTTTTTGVYVDHALEEIGKHDEDRADGAVTWGKTYLSSGVQSTCPGWACEDEHGEPSQC